MFEGNNTTVKKTKKKTTFLLLFRDGNYVPVIGNIPTVTSFYLQYPYFARFIFIFFWSR